MDIHLNENHKMRSATEVYKIERIKPGRQLLYPAQSPRGYQPHKGRKKNSHTDKKYVCKVT